VQDAFTADVTAAYIAEAAAAGDDATTAKEGALVTEQALVGRFWADPTVPQATSTDLWAISGPDPVPLAAL
jgi:hypothetical protein